MHAYDRASFSRIEKKGTFPRLSDPPSLLAKRSGRHRRGGKGRRVEGVIAEEKVAVLETCAQGWVKEAVSIRVLAKKMATAGLDGFEVIGGRDRMGLLSVVVAVERVVCDRGGVRSAGDVECDNMGVRSHKALFPECVPIYDPDWDSVDSKAQGSVGVSQRPII
ncbi:hypothetical protein V6N12_053001 [Hibiscus sabdariffa]|uniref:Uncharacterized protein n=1 Tax=Hibiscus sabdariffa TaxID=183260 RepID=A0ABR2ACX2_9ROSI